MVLSSLLWLAGSAVLNLIFMPTTYHSLQRRLSFVAFCLFLSIIHCNLGFASAQVLSNGQIFTNGLAIVDSPQPNTPLHAGSALNFAVDISGDGRLPADASIPYSGQPTSFNALGVFLISAQTSLNVTVSNTPSLLTQEPGSTVKHLNWPIPQCLPAGQYNLTIYECSLVDGVSHFSITPIPVQIDNTSMSGNCSLANNALFPQPQPSNPPPINPFLNPTYSSTLTTPSRMSTSVVQPNPAGVITVTLGPTGIAYPITVVGSNSETLVYQTAPPSGEIVTLNGSIIATSSGPSGSGQEITVTVSPTPVTIVYVSLSTVVSTLTALSQTTVETSIATSYSTTTAIMDVTNPEQFLPVNSATGISAHSILLYSLPLFISAAFFLL